MVLFAKFQILFVLKFIGLPVVKVLTLQRVQQLPENKMDVLHGEGIRAILWLQNTLGSYADNILFLSRVGDPGSILLYFPITLYISKTLGVMVLWVAVMAEWTNLVLKW